MNISLKSLIVPGVILLLALASWLSYSSYKGEKKRADDAEQSLSLANATITDMQTRQRDVAALDAKYTKELSDAKKRLDDLQRCVRDGKCGLHVNARCPTNGTTSTGGVGHDATVELSDVAGRNVLGIRSGIKQDQSALRALQEYINTQCLK